MNPAMDPPLSHFAERDCLIHITCHAPGCQELQKLHRHWGTTNSAKAAAEQWGGDTTLPDLKRRLRCCLCNTQGLALIEVSGPAPPGMGGYSAGARN